MDERQTTRTDSCSAPEKKAYHSFKMIIHGFRRVTQTSISKDVLVFWEVVRNVCVPHKLFLMKGTKNTDAVHKIQ